MAIHGFVRATVDIDVLIGEEAFEKAYKSAAENGFDIRELDIDESEKRIGRESAKE